MITTAAAIKTVWTMIIMMSIKKALTAIGIVNSKLVMIIKQVMEDRRSELFVFHRHLWKTWGIFAKKFNHLPMMAGVISNKRYIVHLYDALVIMKITIMAPSIIIIAQIITRARKTTKITVIIIMIAMRITTAVVLRKIITISQALPFASDGMYQTLHVLYCHSWSVVTC